MIALFKMRDLIESKVWKETFEKLITASYVTLDDREQEPKLPNGFLQKVAIDRLLRCLETTRKAVEELTTYS